MEARRKLDGLGQHGEDGVCPNLDQEVGHLEQILQHPQRRYVDIVDGSEIDDQRAQGLMRCECLGRG
eukprot:CAMPEP_0181243044 /NCGR_PEP_ID=MMETSP1096-20121128/42031_1 /TAXON_ID=156174 ORGANISM="Chrysochromulina ericina, Strain CCMP281" /NCGR_SAMPLE_ID=MMETSP1096 /ASSEMBLY_ACC=CAM_ASM_000453 /LENGTH=66 /DNA_ID=CAMNT_0023339329 /DNA_START=361 /DNA_END=558 /DNA_ORIENTATION=-